MKMRKNKWLAGLLAVIMIFGIMPAGVLGDAVATLNAPELSRSRPGDNYDPMLTWTFNDNRVTSFSVRVAGNPEIHQTVPVPANTAVGFSFTFSLANFTLTIGEAYTVYVVAMADGFTSAPSNNLTFIPALPVMPTPQNFTITNGIATWNRVADATHYVISAMRGGLPPVAATQELPWYLAHPEGGLNLNALLELAGGVSYTVMVRARRAGHVDSEPATATFIPTGAGAPAQNRLATPTGLTIAANVLTWNSVPYATGFNILLEGTGASAGELFSGSSTTNSINFATMALQPGTFNITVTATAFGTAWLDSLPSAPLAHAIAAGGGTQIIPQPAASITGTQLNWSIPGLFPIQNAHAYNNLTYTIRIYHFAQGIPQIINIGANAPSTYNLNTRQWLSNSNYFLTVTANAFGAWTASQPSPQIGFVTNAAGQIIPGQSPGIAPPPGTAPDYATRILAAPIGLTITGNTLLNWTASRYATRYEITVTGTGASVGRNYFGQTNSNETQFNLATLGMGAGTYSVTVRATAPGSNPAWYNSPQSAAIAFVMQASWVSHQQLPPPVISSIDQGFMTWAMPQHFLDANPLIWAQISYIIYATPRGGANPQTITTGAGVATRNLNIGHTWTPNTEYSVVIRATAPGWTQSAPSFARTFLTNALGNAIGAGHDGTPQGGPLTAPHIRWAIGNAHRIAIWDSAADNAVYSIRINGVEHATTTNTSFDLSTLPNLPASFTLTVAASAFGRAGNPISNTLTVTPALFPGVYTPSLIPATTRQTFAGRDFQVFNGGMTWDMARAHAQSLGGDLAVVRSAGQQEFLRNLAEQSGKSDFWLGGTRAATTGTRQFSWITGEAFSFTNWATNQPDNMATIEDRLVMNRNGTWHDFPNAGHNADQLRRFGFIVEWPAANAPVIGNVSVAPLPVVHGSQLTIGVTGLVNVSRLYLFTRTTAGVDAPVQMRHFVQPNEIFNPIIHDVNVDRIVLRAYNAAGVWIEHESDITVVDGDILLMPPNPALVLTPTITRIGVALDWVSPTQSPLGYRIFRSTSPGTLGVPVSDRPIMMRNAFDPNVNRGQVHYYRVVPITVAESMNLVTLVVTPEQWGAPSAPVRVAIPMTMPVTNEQFHFPRPGEGATIPVGSRQFITMNIGDPVMNVNNEHTPVDPGYNTAPVIRSDRTMVPIRATVEAMGGTLSWYAPLQRVGIYAPGRTIYLRVGHTAFTVNGQTQHMDEAPFISPTYRTMVPLRFAAQSLGAEVEWIAARQRVIIVWTE